MPSKHTPETALTLPPTSRDGRTRLDQWRYACRMVEEAGPFRVGHATEFRGRIAVAAVLEARANGGLHLLPDGEAHRIALDAARHLAQDARGDLRHLMAIQGVGHIHDAVNELTRWQRMTGRAIFEATGDLAPDQARRDAADARAMADLAVRARLSPRIWLDSADAVDPDVGIVDDEDHSITDAAELAAEAAADPTHPMHDARGEAEADRVPAMAGRF